MDAVEDGKVQMVACEHLLDEVEGGLESPTSATPPAKDVHCRERHGSHLFTDKPEGLALPVIEVAA